MSVKFNSALGGSVTLHEPATASAFNLTLPTDNIQPGMNLITPTSVVGGTFVGGNISFSAASSLSVNGCFTNTYENYLMLLNYTPSNGSIGFNGRLRSSGVDVSGANYSYNQSIFYAATFVVATNTGQTYINLIDQTASVPNSLTLTVFSPALAVATGFQVHGSRNYSTSPSNYLGHGGHSLATSYDGFSMYPTSGTITGTIRIYGMRNQ